MSTGRAGRAGPSPEQLVAVPTFRDEPSTAPADLEGTDLAGRPVTSSLTAPGRLTLLLFLSSSCGGCAPLWAAAAAPEHWGLPPDASVVAVTRGAPSEDVAVLRSVVPPEVALVISDAAFRSYRVLGAPFFTLVLGGRPRVITEGVAVGVAQVSAAVASSLDLDNSRSLPLKDPRSLPLKER